MSMLMLLHWGTVKQFGEYMSGGQKLSTLCYLQSDNKVPTI